MIAVGGGASGSPIERKIRLFARDSAALALNVHGPFIGTKAAQSFGDGCQFHGALLAEPSCIVEGWTDRAIMGDMQIGCLRKVLKILRCYGENRAGLAIQRFGYGSADCDIDIGLHQNDSGGRSVKPDGFGQSAGSAAGTPAFQHHEDLAFEAYTLLRVVNVDNDSAAGIESAPKAQGFIEK
jgi:hypothetical protein